MIGGGVASCGENCCCTCECGAAAYSDAGADE